MEPIAILGTKSKIIFNEFCALSTGAGIKCNDICMTIIITKVEEKPSHTALLATLRP